jgi:hypothetical protein
VTELEPVPTPPAALPPSVVTSTDPSPLPTPASALQLVALASVAGPQVPGDKQRTVPESVAVAPAEPYVTRGVVLVEDTEAMPPKTPQPDPELPSLLKHRAQEICGDSARVAHVSLLGESKVLIEINFPRGATTETVARRIMALPELRGYDPLIQVSFP